MTSYDYDIGIIGGGAAGLTVAAGAAQLGARTLLVEREPQLGGDCLHYGCVPSKTLIRTAAVYHLLGQAMDYGLPAVERPPIDFKEVRSRIRSVIAAIQPHDSVERFTRLGARVEFGAATFADEHTILIGGKRRSAARWVIASGSRASIPELPGLAGVPFLTNREIFYLDHLPDSMIILGGGPIAVEIAQAFNRLGTRVEVVQRSGQILSREDGDLAGMIMTRLASEGVNFHLDTALEAVQGDSRQIKLTYRDNAGTSRELVASTLFVALGRSPATEGLNLDRIGVDFDRRGIKVDSRLRTTQRHIYAAGDVNGISQFTHTAGYEGGIVISNAVFRLPRRVNYDLIPRCTYTDPEFAILGHNERTAKEAGLAYTVWRQDFASNDRGQAEGTTNGTVKLLLDRRDRPLGVQIFGPHAGELLNEWVAAMNGKVGLTTLASAVHPYPTLGEINKRLAASPLSQKIFSAKVKKALAFFFRLRGPLDNEE